jgi:3-dehydroquinate dehydratase-1
VRAVEALLDGLKGVTGVLVGTALLVCFRRYVDGGATKDYPEALRSKMLEAAVKSGLIDLVDVAIDDDASVFEVVSKSAKETGTRLVLSHHDFSGIVCEEQLLAKVTEAQDKGADIASLAYLARDAEDVITLARATRKAKIEKLAKIPLCLYAMGEVGLITRVAGSRYGSDYCSFALDGPSAGGLEDSAQDYIDLRAAFASADRTKPQSKVKVTVKAKVIGGKGFLYACPIRSGNRISLMQDVREALTYGPDIIEWRTDFFSPILDTDFATDLLAQTLEELSAILGDVPLLLCMRDQSEGAFRYTSPKVRMKVIETCLSTGLVDLVDVETFGEEHFTQEVRRLAKRFNAKLILSNHNYAGIGSEEKMIEALVACRDRGADIAKLYYTANCDKDVIDVARTAKRVKDEALIDIPFCFTLMGDCGLIARVMGYRYGNDYCYFSLRGAKGGQEEDMTYYLGLREAFGIAG